MRINPKFIVNNGRLEKRLSSDFREFVYQTMREKVDRIFYGTPTAISKDPKTGILNPACLEVARLLGVHTRIYVGSLKDSKKARDKILEQWIPFGFKYAYAVPVAPKYLQELLWSLKRPTDIVFMMSGQTAGYKEVWEEYNSHKPGWVEMFVMSSQHCWQWVHWK